MACPYTVWEGMGRGVGAVGQVLCKHPCRSLLPSGLDRVLGRSLERPASALWLQKCPAIHASCVRCACMALWVDVCFRLLPENTDSV